MQYGSCGGDGGILGHYRRWAHPLGEGQGRGLRAGFSCRPSEAGEFHEAALAVSSRNHTVIPPFSETSGRCCEVPLLLGEGSRARSELTPPSAVPPSSSDKSSTGESRGPSCTAARPVAKTLLALPVSEKRGVHTRVCNFTCSHAGWWFLCYRWWVLFSCAMLV